MSETTDQVQVQVLIWMPADLRDEIDALAGRLDMNRSQLIRRACRELLIGLPSRLIDVSDDTTPVEVAS